LGSKKINFLIVQFTPLEVSLKCLNWYQEPSIENYSSFDPMVEGKLFYAEGASINRPTLFNEVNYPFWKIRMKMFIQSLNSGV